jgi:hypothetical protein
MKGNTWFFFKIKTLTCLKVKILFFGKKREDPKILVSTLSNNTIFCWGNNYTSHLTPHYAPFKNQKNKIP